jgi:hypothetical protein
VPSVEEILTALLKPCLEFLAQDQEFLLVHTQFMGRCWAEPEPLKSIVEREFATSMEALFHKACFHQEKTGMYLINQNFLI